MLSKRAGTASNSGSVGGRDHETRGPPVTQLALSKDILGNRSYTHTRTHTRARARTPSRHRYLSCQPELRASPKASTAPPNFHFFELMGESNQALKTPAAAELFGNVLLHPGQGQTAPGATISNNTITEKITEEDPLWIIIPFADESMHLAFRPRSVDGVVCIMAIGTTKVLFLLGTSSP